VRKRVVILTKWRSEMSELVNSSGNAEYTFEEKTKLEEELMALIKGHRPEVISAVFVLVLHRVLGIRNLAHLFRSFNRD
jgi:hypothetical protein